MSGPDPDGAGPDGAGPAGGAAAPRDTRGIAVSGARWGVVSALLEQGGSLLSTVVLARLLTPADFGIVAAVTIVVTLFALLGGLGFGAGLVRRGEVDELTLSSTFWAAATVGLVLSVACAATSPGLARLLGQPEAAPYLAAISPILLVAMLSNVSEALLQRRLQFTHVYAADVVAIVVNVVASIATALAGAGAWALIAGRLAGSVAGTAYRLVASRWRPTRRFSWAVVRGDLGFNLGFFGLGLSGFANKNLDNLVVSRTSTAASLGNYYVAYVIPNILRQRMTWLSNELLFPVLARAEGADAQRRMYERMIGLLTMLAFPILIGVAAVAPEVIAVGFGPQWQDAVAPMRILALAAAVDVLVATANPVFLSRGRPGVANRTAVTRLVVLGAGLVLAVRGGSELSGVAWAVAVSTAAAVAVTWVGLVSLLDVDVARLVRLVSPAAVASAVMYGAVELLRRQGPELTSPLARFAAYSVCGAAVFVVVAWLVDRAAVRDWLRFARELVTRRAAAPSGEA